MHSEGYNPFLISHKPLFYHFFFRLLFLGHFLASTLQTYMKPSLVRQRNESDAKYFKAKRERVKLVEELVLQKKYFPW